MNKEYWYPDIGDKVTAALIKEKEQFPSYWERSEKRILRVVEETIRKRGIRPADSWLLDAGCGTGRLLPEFHQFFANILAIDPDSTQIEKAKVRVREQGFAEKVVFKVTPIEQLDWREESIDVILCSHVIQHVHTEAVPKILNKFYEVLKPNGLLFLMTTYSRRSYGYYSRGFLKDSRNVEERIKKEEFNFIIKNDKNILPIHFFSLNNLTNIIKDSSFFLDYFKTYHILRTSSNRFPYDDTDNSISTSSCSKNNIGRDILLISHKTVRPTKKSSLG